MPISPTQSNVLEALRKFLQAVCPANQDTSPYTVVQGVQNRAAEPKQTSFAVIWPIRFERLRTNVDSAADCRFLGSIALTTLTAAAPTIGSIAPPVALFGTNVAAGTRILSQLTGTPGGAGTYLVAPSQTVTSEVLSAGTVGAEQGAEVVVQIDFHSADGSAVDVAQTVSTLLRDPYGVDFFAALDPPLNSVFPLHADNPRYVPFINEGNQYEWRWTLDAHLQINQVASVPQQYADAASVTLESVEAAFPP